MADEQYGEYTLSQVEEQHPPGYSPTRVIKVIDKNGESVAVSVDPSSIRPSEIFFASMTDGRIGGIPFQLDENGNPHLAPHDGKIPPPLIPDNVLCEAVRRLVKGK